MSFVCSLFRVSSSSGPRCVIPSALCVVFTCVSGGGGHSAGAIPAHSVEKHKAPDF